MAWSFIGGWFARGRQYFQSIKVGVRAASYLFGEAAKGKSISEVLRQTGQKFGVDLEPRYLKEAIRTGEVITPKGPVTITPEMVRKSVAGAIPQEWTDLVKIRAIKQLDKKNIFGRWMHYKVRLQVFEEYETAEGERRMRIKDVWTTVATDRPLTTQETMARASELAMREPDWQVPASGTKGIVGIPEIHPYQYLPETEAIPEMLPPIIITGTAEWE